MILFFENDNKDFGNGVSFLINEGNGHIIWKILSFLACKAIGIEEYQANKRESGKRFYPDDYPLT